MSECSFSGARKIVSSLVWWSPHISYTSLQKKEKVNFSAENFFLSITLDFIALEKWHHFLTESELIKKALTILANVLRINGNLKKA